jgi:hypothetical protein
MSSVHSLKPSHAVRDGPIKGCWCRRLNKCEGCPSLAQHIPRKASAWSIPRGVQKICQPFPEVDCVGHDASRSGPQLCIIAERVQNRTAGVMKGVRKMTRGECIAIVKGGCGHVQGLEDPVAHKLRHVVTRVCVNKMGCHDVLLEDLK